MAYFLNSYIHLNLTKLPFNLKLSEEVSFSLYEWEDQVKDIKWNLISNISRINTKSDSGIFKNSMVMNYCIPEYKKVDYFLKIESENTFSMEQKRVVNKIVQIPQVMTAYLLNPSQLKSKNNLIFLSNAK